MIKQITLEEWPESLNEKVAMVCLTPKEISSRAGIMFERSYDSLDEFDGAVLDLDGSLVGLLSYFKGPVKGTNIVLVDELAADDRDGLLQGALQSIGANRDDVIWIKYE